MKIFVTEELLWERILLGRNVEEHAIDGSEPAHQLQIVNESQQIHFNNVTNCFHIGSGVSFSHDLDGEGHEKKMKRRDNERRQLPHYRM